MKDEWFEDPLRGYEENARYLFGHTGNTCLEYARDLGKFLVWLSSQGDRRAKVEGRRPVVASRASCVPRRASCDSVQGWRESEDGTSGRVSGNGSLETNDAGPVKRDAGRVASQRLLVVNREDVEQWIVALSNRGLRATTINRKIASLNSFYVWALHNRLVENSPLTGIRKLKVPRRIPKFLTFEDVHKLLSYTGSLRRTSTVRGKQVHAMISILYYLGVRRAELVDIRFEHIEKVTDTEIYLHIFGKGDKQRLVPFPAPAFEAYQGYVRYRPECSFPQVFVSLHTRHPMSKYDVNNVCDQLSRRVQLTKKLTPHLLRHTFATHLHLRGQPIEHINALLGHESLDTTKIYVHIDSGKLRESVEELVGVSGSDPKHKSTQDH